MIRWLKSKLWPCKHGVDMLAGGVVTHKSLRVSSTNTGNVYRCTIWCRRCQTMVMRFEGTIDERLSEESARILGDAYPVIVAPPGVNIWGDGEQAKAWRDDAFKKLERDWMDNFEDPDLALMDEKQSIEESTRPSSKTKDLLG